MEIYLGREAVTGRKAIDCRTSIGLRKAIDCRTSIGLCRAVDRSAATDKGGGFVLLKLAGSIMVLGAATAAGFGAARALDNQVLELERLEVALETLSSGVSYLLEPLPQAMTKAGERAGGGVGRLFCLLGSSSGLSNRRTPQDALLSAIAEGRTPDAPRVAMDVVGDLVKSLGTSGHKEQVRYIDMSIDRVRSHKKSIEDEYRKKARMFRYLGVLAGLSVVIVLI